MNRSKFLKRSGSAPDIIHASKLAGLQYLRAVASIAVVVFHAASRNGLEFDIGQAGVDVFFVLSGFLMWKVTANGTTPRRFLGDRIKRIVPIYWIVTTVMLIGTLAGLFPAIRLTVDHIATSYVFIASISPSNGHVWPLLVPGWTLNYEMFFYVVFAAILFMPQRCRLYLLTLTLGGLVLAGLILRPSSVVAGFYTDPILIEFLMGALLAASLQFTASLSLYNSLLMIVFSLAGFAIAWNHDWHEPRAIVYGLPAFMALLGIIALERNGALPQLPLLIILGDASYSIYLSHTLTIALVTKWGNQISVSEYLLAAVSTLSSIAIGLLMYRWIEKPMMNKLRFRNR